MEGLIVTNQAVKVTVAEGWPSLDAIQNVAANSAAVIGVYEKTSRMDVRFFPRRFKTVVNATGIASAVSAQNCAAGQSRTLTLSYAHGSSAVNLNDAVSLILDTGINRAFLTVNTSNGISRLGAVAVAAAGESLASLATKLADSINATSTLNGLVSASASGPTVTITNTSSGEVKLSTAVGNIALIYKSLAQNCLESQIICYCGSWDIRRAISDLLEVQLAQYRAQYGFALTNGANKEMVRVTAAQHFFLQNDSDTPANVYRQDFFMMMDYGIYAADVAYSVLVPIANQQVF